MRQVHHGNEAPAGCADEGRGAEASLGNLPPAAIPRHCKYSCLSVDDIAVQTAKVKLSCKLHAEKGEDVSQYILQRVPPTQCKLVRRKVSTLRCGWLEPGLHLNRVRTASPPLAAPVPGTLGGSAGAVLAGTCTWSPQTLHVMMIVAPPPLPAVAMLEIIQSPF